jgi:hypothetical protein
MSSEKNHYLNKNFKINHYWTARTPPRLWLTEDSPQNRFWDVYDDDMWPVLLSFS